MLRSGPPRSFVAIEELIMGQDFAQHPVVGAWRWSNLSEDADADVSYGVYHADGTYLETFRTLGTAIGSWKATGERTADLTYVFQDLSEDPNAIEPGSLTIRGTAEVDDAGVVRARFTLDARKLDGAIAFQSGPHQAFGTRIEVEPMVPFDPPATDTPAT